MCGKSKSDAGWPKAKKTCFFFTEPNGAEFYNWNIIPPQRNGDFVINNNQ